MSRRTNVTPEETEAVQRSVEAMEHAKEGADLREQLREGAIRRAKRDLEMTEEWSGDEAWESE